MTTHPRIGIRPIIDGRRRGVRESLEDQTMNMAKRVKELYESELRYYDGEPVEAVIADTTIGRVSEAQATAEKFRRENVGLTLSVTPCWCYGTETIDMDRTMPHAIWGFNGSERPGAVYLAAALAGHTQLGIPAFGIYGEHVQDADDETIPDDVRQRLLDYATAGLAVAQMKGRSYLAMGGVSMGIAGSVVKDEFWSKYLGMRNEYIDMSEIDRRVKLEIYDTNEYEKARAWVRENFVQGDDRNPEQVQEPENYEAWWDYSVKMTLICRDLMVGNPALTEQWGEEAGGHGALVAGFQGQRQWTDHMPNGDVMETILNTSFDWNGPRAPFIMATENDSLNGASMLVNYLLTGQAQLFSDVRTYWSPESVERVTGYTLTGKAASGIIDLRNSGSTTLDGTFAAQRDGNNVIKPFWEITEQDQKAMLEATRFHPANLEYFRGGGMSTHFRSQGAEVPVTMTRINLVDGLGPVLQLAEGWSVELPDEVATIIEDRTDPTWPTTWFVPRLTGTGAFTSGYAVMNAWGANHGAISYGHIGARIITLAAMLRIPVNMHNIADGDIFRPKNWLGFGTSDLEGADFRACAQFGPLYA